MTRAQIQLRGGLGNQVIEALIGTSVMLEKGHRDFEYIFFNKVAAEHKEFYGQIDKLYLNQIFDIKQDILFDSKRLGKTRYWLHGSVQIYAKWYKYILSDLSLVLFKSKKYKSVVHVSCIGDGTMVDHQSCFENLIHIALAKHGEVAIVGDNQALIKQLVKKFSNFNVVNPESIDAVHDWQIIHNSEHVYCSPSTFAFSSKLVSPTKNIYIINPYHYTSYKHAINEYNVLYDMKKFFGGVEILPAFIDKRKSINLDKKSFVNPLVYELNNYSHDSSNVFESKTLACMEQYISSTLGVELARDSKYNKEKMSYHQSVEILLRKELDSLRLSESLFKGLKKAASDYFLSAYKQKPKCFPPILEEAGMSILRHYLFNYLYIMRATKRLEKLKKDSKSYVYLNHFIQNGYLIIENCIPLESSENVISYFSKRNGSLFKTKDTLLFKSNSEEQEFNWFLGNDLIAFLSLLTGYDKSSIQDELFKNTFFQTVKLTKDDQHKDQQQLFHIDTFYPAFKFWYFPFEVKNSDAPFEYAVKSHLPTASQLSYFHSRYLDNSYDRDYAISPDNQEGSLRITESSLKILNLSTKKFAVPANSLVIANVGGFHRRSIHNQNVKRHAVHSSIRPKNIYDDIYV